MAKISGSRLTARICRQKVRGFYVVGRGGLPPSAQDPFAGNSGEMDLLEPAPCMQTAPSSASQNSGDRDSTSRENLPKTDEIIEATGWFVNAEGSVELVARAPSTSPQNFCNRTPKCSYFCAN